MHGVPSWTVRNVNWHVHVLVLRMRNLQHGDRQDYAMHKQVRHWPVLQLGSLRMLVVPPWHVRDNDGRVRLRGMPSRAVPAICRPDVLLQLRVWHVQHQHRPHQRVHSKVCHRVLLWLRRHRVHSLSCWQVHNTHRCVQLYQVLLRSLPACDGTNIVRGTVPGRQVRQHWCVGVLELPRGQVLRQPRCLQLLQLRVRPLPAKLWADLVHVSVPTWQVLWNACRGLHQLPSGPVLSVIGCVQLHLLLCRTVPDADRPEHVFVLRLWYVQPKPRPEDAVHREVQRWVLLKCWQLPLHLLPGWPLLHDERLVFVHGLRLRHLQLLPCKTKPMHK
jgi:hypothetical protein